MLINVTNMRYIVN